MELFFALRKQDNLIYIGGERQQAIEHMRRLKKAGFKVVAYATDRQKIREAGEKVMYG
ncbi:hypothetical protein M3689_05445 [Alkalihalophilus marmarensis]|uniref:hypothetical protein n=1 Tax=Alkalihalophilus marmarensis TaxID=521377 RepID=UPI0020408FD6|nr:hypothetical protein [Alkalihalophilus marmarensis]MCM3488750.1 hypothetical protein [Alkalihalophilus marmarensis]